MIASIYIDNEIYYILYKTPHRSHNSFYYNKNLINKIIYHISNSISEEVRRHENFS